MNGFQKIGCEVCSETMEPLPQFEIPEELKSNILEALDLMVIDEKNDTFYSAPDVETARKWQQELDIGNRGLKIIK